MGTFNTEKLLDANPILAHAIAEEIANSFKMEGYESKIDCLAENTYDISLAKGNVFRAVLGMKSALKISLIPQDDKIFFKAGVGIFGQQAIPTAVTMLFFWPVIITQVWGLVQQSKLDDKALLIAEHIISTNAHINDQTSTPVHQTFQFCSNCGSKISPDARFCPNCGTKI